MPKLPAYVFRRQNGSYRYKRNVPKKLRHLIGKDTLYQATGGELLRGDERPSQSALGNRAAVCSRRDDALPMNEPWRLSEQRWARKLRIWSWLVISLNTAKRNMR